MKDKSSLFRILLALTATLLLVILIVAAFSIYLSLDDNSSIEPTPSIIDISQTHSPEPTDEPIKTVSLSYAEPSDFGFSQDGIDNLDNFIESEINAGFPGAVIMVARNDNIIFHKSYGYFKDV